MGKLEQDLAELGLEFIETHASWVFLGEAKVWKVKKPVDFGFLDFRTVEKRRAACEAELRLNARLAPEVYEAVVPITRDASGQHRIEGAGEIVDWAVRMVRLADAQRGDLLLAVDALRPDDVEYLAEHIAEFHRAAPTNSDIARFGELDVMLSNVRENFAQTRDSIEAYITASQAAEIEQEQVGFLEKNSALFHERVERGRIREGHGDLRLEHVYFRSGARPVIIDCIEFNERFRCADVCADVAFLSMDLERLGRSDLAEHFLAAYAQAANDYELYRLIDFYEAYRAYVRGKVASILASDQGAEFATRERARADARRSYLLALLQGRRALIEPTLIAVGGVIASGKTTVARRLGTRIAAPVVQADRTRKELLGIEATARVDEPAWSGAYSPNFTERVYTEVLRRGSFILGSGRSAVLDASFRSRAVRDRARALAREHGAAFLFVECRTDLDECRRRLTERALVPGVSDGRSEIFDDFVARWEPTTELAREEHVILDTSLPVETSLNRLEQSLRTWPAGFGG